MRAGQQGLGASLGCTVAADHVANGIDADFVKTAVAHPAADALGAGTVRVGQVGHGEFTALGVAGVAVLGQLLLPVPDLVAQRRLDAELVVQADFDDAVDVAQAFAQLIVRVTQQAALEGVDDLPLAQAGAARSAHRQDEGEAELGVVVGVQLLDAGEFLGRAIGQAGLALLMGGFGGQRLADHGLAGQFRVGADQGQLGVTAGSVQRLDHRMLEFGQRVERALLQRGCSYPRRMLVQAVQHLRGLGRAGAVELVQGQWHCHHSW